MSFVLPRGCTFWRDDAGATMVEYSLMLALIAVVCAIAVKTLGTNTKAGFTAGADCIVTPGAGACP